MLDCTYVCFLNVERKLCIIIVVYCMLWWLSSLLPTKLADDYFNYVFHLCAQELQLHLGVLQQHAALIGGPNATSCPICHKLFLGADALMEHMKHTHKDPNANAGATSKYLILILAQSSRSILIFDAEMDWIGHQPQTKYCQPIQRCVHFTKAF